MPIVGLDHVQVAVPAGSEQEVRGFYGDLLGLPEIPKPEGLMARGGVWFQVGPQELHVGLTPDFVAAIKAHPAFLVPASELDQLAAALNAAGSPIRWDDAIPEVRRFYTDDPWGNRLEMVEHTA